MNKPLHQVPPSYQGFTRADFDLTPKQWGYVLHRITQGPTITNAKCAQAAGYSVNLKKNPSIASHPDINRAITTLDNQAVQEVEERHIAAVITREQGLGVLSALVLDEDIQARDRIKAIEVLARMQRWGETTSKPVTINIDTTSALEGIAQADQERIAREASQDEPGRTAPGVTGLDQGPAGPEATRAPGEARPQQQAMSQGPTQPDINKREQTISALEVEGTPPGELIQVVSHGR